VEVVVLIWFWLASISIASKLRMLSINDTVSRKGTELSATEEPSAPVAVVVANVVWMTLIL
jgi:hypothetical protein